MANKQTRTRQKMLTRRRAKKAWKKAAPALVPVSARWAAKFERSLGASH
jgi:hypothetical protein